MSLKVTKHFEVHCKHSVFGQMHISLLPGVYRKLNGRLDKVAEYFSSLPDISEVCIYYSVSEDDKYVDDSKDKT